MDYLLLEQYWKSKEHQEWLRLAKRDYHNFYIANPFNYIEIEEKLVENHKNSCK